MSSPAVMARSSRATLPTGSTSSCRSRRRGRCCCRVRRDIPWPGERRGAPTASSRSAVGPCPLGTERARRTRRRSPSRAGVCPHRGVTGQQSDAIAANGGEVGRDEHSTIRHCRRCRQARPSGPCQRSVSASNAARPRRRAKATIVATPSVSWTLPPPVSSRGSAVDGDFGPRRQGRGQANAGRTPRYRRQPPPERTSRRLPGTTAAAASATREQGQQQHPDDRQQPPRWGQDADNQRRGAPAPAAQIRRRVGYITVAPPSARSARRGCARPTRPSISAAGDAVTRWRSTGVQAP